MRTRGIHVVWTTYGTWLPGDDRGHWSPLFDLYGRLIRAGHQINLPDETTRRVARARMVDPPKALTHPERVLVGCRLGQWFPPEGDDPRIYHPRCYAATVADNHVHLELAPMTENLYGFVGRLKGTTASMLKKLPANWERTHFWTAHFWRAFLYDDEAVLAVRQYIVGHNRRLGLCDDPYPWVRPPI